MLPLIAERLETEGSDTNDENTVQRVFLSVSLSGAPFSRTQ